LHLFLEEFELKKKKKMMMMMMMTKKEKRRRQQNQNGCTNQVRQEEEIHSFIH
jgi:hypothetical protein